MPRFVSSVEDLSIYLKRHEIVSSCRCCLHLVAQDKNMGRQPRRAFRAKQSTELPDLCSINNSFVDALWSCALV
jgi:hypothetical protein